MSESTERDFAEQVARVTAAFAGASNGTLEEDQRDSSRRIALELIWPELYAALDALVWDGEMSPEQVRKELVGRPDPRPTVAVGTKIESWSEEPDRSTTWRDTDGDVWRWGVDWSGRHTGWHFGGLSDARSWKSLTDHYRYFPMVRVS